MQWGHIGVALGILEKEMETTKYLGSYIGVYI